MSPLTSALCGCGSLDEKEDWNSPPGVLRQAFCPTVFPTPCGDPLWANGKIPFEFDANVPVATQTAVNAAMLNWEQTVGGGVIDFVQHSSEMKFLVFSSGAGCGGANRASTLPVFRTGDCGAGQLRHELGHVIGFEHGQQRADRNRYIQLAQIDGGLLDGGQNFQCFTNSDGSPQSGGVDTVTQCGSAWSSPSNRPGGDFGVFNFNSVMLYSSVGGSGLTANYGLPPAGDRSFVRRGVADDAFAPCESDVFPAWTFGGSPAITPGDGAAAVELYRTVNGWAPFKSMGQDVGATAPLSIGFSTGVTIAGDPALISLGSTTLRAFAKGTDSKFGKSVAALGCRARGKASARRRVSRPAKPAAISWSQSTSRIDVVVIANRLVFKRAFYGGAWEGAWESSIGAPAGGAFSSPAISSGATNNLNVYVVGSSGQLFTKEWSGAWGNWWALPALPAGVTVSGVPAATARAAGLRDVMSRKRRGLVLHCGKRLRLDLWVGILVLAGNWRERLVPGVGRPALASWGMSQVDVFVRGADSYLWQTTCSSTGCGALVLWSQFAALGGVLAGSPSASSPRGTSRIDVIATMNDGASFPVPSTAKGVWHKWWPW
ncbi:MAG: hypothetical protein IPJ65_43215 [Archangiaceae bacterium]|nr:hypothetical protein [Archangiaceae bacterium]